MLDFLGIGAQKAGTTWLWANLRRHPGLFLPDIKELHFWDRQYTRGLDWYRAQFAPAPPGRLKGEITPAYAILPRERILEIHHQMPEARLVYMLRNPVERAWSSALMALGRAEMTLEDASDRWFIDHFLSAGSAARGDYEGCLRRWTEIYPRDRMLVLLFDQVLSDPRAVLTRCAAHLGADPAPFQAIPEAELREAHFAGSGDPIRPSLHGWLARHYAPRIESLERLLDMDLGAWRQANAAAPANTPLWRLRVRLGRVRGG